MVPGAIRWALRVLEVMPSLDFLGMTLWALLGRVLYFPEPQCPDL